MSLGLGFRVSLGGLGFRGLHLPRALRVQASGFQGLWSPKGPCTQIL